MWDIAQLKTIRLQHGLTQAAFASLAGVSQSLITKIESQKLDPKYSTVQRITQAITQLQQKNQRTLASVLHKGCMSAHVHETLAVVAKRMQRNNISQLPVLSHGHPVGIITETALVHAMTEQMNFEKTAVKECMLETPPLLPSNTPLGLAQQLLEHIPIILVVEKNKIIGVVTKADLLRTFR